MVVRRKKKSGAWKGFAAGMGLAGIFGLLLLWAVAGPSGTKLREVFGARMSVMADRADQFIDAWNRRSLPDKPKSDRELTTPATERPRVTTPRSNPARHTAPTPAPAPVRNTPPTAPAPTPTAPAVTSPTQTPQPPEKEVSPDDQQQLRELMQRLNQGN